jgi:hypothetical protein
VVAVARGVSHTLEKGANDFAEHKWVKFLLEQYDQVLRLCLAYMPHHNCLQMPCSGAKNPGHHTFITP